MYVVVLKSDFEICKAKIDHIKKSLREFRLHKKSVNFVRQHSSSVFNQKMLSIIGNVLDQLVARNVFHLTNTIFEGCIGLAHLFLPGKIYEKTFIESHSEQILLGRYYGVMMISLAMISFGARMDRRVAKGLSL